MNKIELIEIKWENISLEENNQLISDYIEVWKGFNTISQSINTILIFEGTPYLCPIEINNIDYSMSDNECQDFSYITINDIDYIYEYNNCGLVLQEIELVDNGPYIDYKLK